MSTLKALFLNCTLKPSPAVSHTEGLARKVIEWFDTMDVESEMVRVADYHVPTGTSSYEGEGDEWPVILDKVKAADIIVMCTPIWFGVRSSVCQLVKIGASLSLEATQLHFQVLELLTGETRDVLLTQQRLAVALHAGLQIKLVALFRVEPFERQLGLDALAAPRLRLLFRDALRQPAQVRHHRADLLIVCGVSLGSGEP